MCGITDKPCQWPLPKIRRVDILNYKIDGKLGIWPVRVITRDEFNSPTLKEEFSLRYEVTDDYLAHMDGEITTEEYLNRQSRRSEKYEH